MKNAKRMIAVIAASGLALGAMPGVANAQGSDILDLDLGTGLLGGSIDVGLDVFVGSAGADSPLTGSLEGVAAGSGEGSSELPTDSLGTASDELDTESLTGGSDDLGSVTESLETGSDSASADLDTESLTGGSDDLGSVTESLGTGSDSESLEGGSLAPILAGSSEAGSDVGSDDLGSVIEGSEAGGGSDAGTLLAVGSLAAVSIGVGLAVSGGSNLPAIPGLPPLPEINFGIVCNLPPEAIDFLKDNGSMEQDECEPEEEQN